MNPSVLDLEPLVLTGCDIIKELNGLKFDDLELSTKLRLKRSPVRTVVIKKQSKSFLKYEMFKRLNTGGEILAAQEIRNCSARMVGSAGEKFYSFIKELSLDDNFINATDTISQAGLDKKINEELVLRYFATKNATDLFKGSVRDWLDDYMESVMLEKVDFNFKKEERIFKKLFKFINNVMADGAFVKYRGELPVGALAPAYFEAVTLGFLNSQKSISAVDPNAIKGELIEVLQSGEFRELTGPGANSRPKLLGRIQLVEDALMELVE